MLEKKEVNTDLSEWNIELTRANLLLAARGILESGVNYPNSIVLNEVWIDLMEDILHQVTEDRDGFVKFRTVHNEENARIIKTDKSISKLLVQTVNTVGQNDAVQPKGEISPPEIFIGVIHKHPSVSPFNTHDLTDLVKINGAFFAGLVDPENYYFAFRTKETPNISDLTNVIRGYMLSLAKKHGQFIVRHRLGVEAAQMSSIMAKELGIAMYSGSRNQRTLKRTA